MFPRFDIFGMALFSYPLLMGAAWGLGLQIVKTLDSRNTSRFKRLNLFLLGVFLFSWMGAKGFYLLSADFSGKEHAIGNANFWLGGGFVFYGGLISGLVFTLVFAWKTRQSIKSFNIFVPALAIGHAVGRLGCFLAGCCYGAPYDGIGAVHMHGLDRYPTQLMEGLTLFALGLLFTAKGFQARKWLVLEYLAIYALVRFLIEFVRGDGIRGIYMYGMSTSQLVSLGFVSLLLAGYFLRVLPQKNKNL